MKKELKKETCPLSNYELNVLLPILMKGLETKKGRANAVTNKQIVQGLKKHGLKIRERQVYKMISYIRRNDLIVGLMSSSNGYYTTNSEREFIGYEHRLFSREASLKKVRLSIERQRRTMFTEHKEKQSQLF